MLCKLFQLPFSQNDQSVYCAACKGECKEAFISEARGGALSFPGFNGESLRVKMRLFFFYVFFMQLLRTVQTQRRQILLFFTVS